MSENYYEGYSEDIDRLENIIIHLEDNSLCDFMIGNAPLFDLLEEQMDLINDRLEMSGIVRSSQVSSELTDLYLRALLILNTKT